MKKKILLISLLIAFIYIELPLVARADVGPKPSVIIEFKGLANEICYATLLSDVSSYGPYNAIESDATYQAYSRDDEDYEIYKKFLSYKDKDGFYFLRYFDNCSYSSRFAWTYYAPPRFKILLYFPEYDKFAVSSEVYEQYAFDSYFIIDLSKIDVASAESESYIKAQKNYDYTLELVSLLVRIIVTIILEATVALLFGFKAKKQIITIIAVNFFTQSILNITLNVINYVHGSMMFLFAYFFIEAIIFIVEAVIYSVLLNKFSKKKKTIKALPAIYALTANAVSFFTGLLIAFLIPGIF